MVDKLNIFIVDDSAVIRKILVKILSTEDSFNVIGQAEDGQMALDMLAKHQGKLDVHVVVMDIEMPIMNGFEALPGVKKLFPKSRVLVASTLTQRGAEASMKALSAGASDYIPKPNPDAASTGGSVDLETFSKDLITKIRILGKAALTSYSFSAQSPQASFKEEAEIKLLPNKKYMPKALVIGSSTGGPEALQTLFKALNKEKLRSIPIFITQHMPAKFTTFLANNITKNTGFDCAEAVDGEIIRQGKVYLAPGDFHMEIVRKDANYVVKLNQNPPINFCRPSVDPMLDSLTELYGLNLLFVMLTGMGADGLESAKRASAKGANIFAQNKETSVVWGMPGAVAKAGICSKVSTIQDMANDISGRF